MSRQLTTTIVGLGVFVLLIGLVITPTISASNEDASRGFELAAGDNATVTEGLKVEIDDVQTGNTSRNATITLRDTGTQLTQTNTIEEGSSANYTVAGENMTVTLNQIYENQETRTTIEYPRTYGWGDGPKQYASRFDVLLGIIGFLMAVGAVGAVTKI